MARKTSFYYSFLVLPPEQRQAIVTVWDFCRAVDDAVDEIDGKVEGDEADAVDEIDGKVEGDKADAVDDVDGRVEGDAADAVDDIDGRVEGDNAGHAADARRAVAFWRSELARAYGEGTPRTPQGAALARVIAPFDLPRQAFEDVIDGVAMDLDTARYETFDDLLTYCHRVASAVGIICINIFGCREAAGAREYALDLGVALQLTNILRDVKDDLDKGRVYLPLEDLRAAGCGVDDLARGVVTEPVRRLLDFECRRAREYYARATHSRPGAERRRLVAAEIMRAVYFETLQRIEMNGFDVFSGRTRVPKPVQALIAVREWLWPR